MIQREWGNKKNANVNAARNMMMMKSNHGFCENENFEEQQQQKKLTTNNMI
jgi:hypothetical protein